MRRNGFTLVELLVALTIFSMLAVAGVALLRFSVDAQAATGARLKELAAQRRVESLILADAAQAVPRITRNEAGDPVQAFEGDASGFTLVRAGVDALGEGARPTLQKVRYSLDGGNLTRSSYAMLDGAAPAATNILLGGVAGLRLRYRSKDGWRDVWDPLRPDLMPRAIELVVRRSQGPEMRYLFLVGAAA
ncbi:type II secretion system minor pseudopilin GspJ [Sphingomonas sp. ID1715]|uniref:type II secretion system minor pseudopilin GspJ n=1 Tax=Sphingomonas sp. ID1715 TaxID=1656898 RepID=UPI00148892E4|nr:type II secretion system minor pseudopilin GspJ [Sphingomonas sp. ID1715]